MLKDYKVWKPACPQCNENNRIIRSSIAIMPGYWLCLNCHHYFKAERMLKPKKPLPKEFYSKETKETFLT